VAALQQLVVILIVVAAALSAAWRLAGVASRLKLLERLARSAGNGRVGAWLTRRAQRQREALLRAGCGGCAGGSAGGSAGGKPPARR
jgi:hypothetical protein